MPSVTEIVGVLSGGVNMDSPIIRQAARRGAAVHEYCELIDYGAPPEQAEPELAGYLRAYSAFLRDYRPEWLFIEAPLYSAVYGYAGRADRIGYIGRTMTAVDIKTTASFDRAAKIKLACQLFGYAEMFEERRAVAVGNHLGVQLHKDGKYTVHDKRKIESRYGFVSNTLFRDLLDITYLTGGYTWRQN